MKLRRLRPHRLRTYPAADRRYSDSLGSGGRSASTRRFKTESV